MKNELNTDCYVLTYVISLQQHNQLQNIPTHVNKFVLSSSVQVYASEKRQFKGKMFEFIRVSLEY